MRQLTVTRIGLIQRITMPIPPALRPFVHERSAFVDSSQFAYAVRLVPTGQVTLLISLGAPFARFDRLDGTHQPVGPIGSLVAGPEDRPRVCEHAGGQEMLRVKLTPLGAYRFLGLPMSELANMAVELGDVLGPEADRLAERLALTRGWARRFDVLDAALLAGIERGPSVAPQVAEVWQRISTAPGTASIAGIAHEIGWSHKHLLRRFTQQVGLTPKALARVARFQNALAMLSTSGLPPAEVSLACGFYDQAHLSRDFRELAGASPGQCAAARWAPPRALALPGQEAVGQDVNVAAVSRGS